MTGDLTIKGNTRPVTLSVVKYGEFNDPMMGHRIGYSAQGKINRKDFGLTFNMMLDGNLSSARKSRSSRASSSRKNQSKLLAPRVPEPDAEQLTKTAYLMIPRATGLSTVGILGQVATFVGAGEVRSGVGTLASPWLHRWWAGAKRQGNRTQGDPRVPTLHPCHPRPYEANPLPCSFHKIPTLESLPQRGLAVGVSVAFPVFTPMGWLNLRRPGGMVCLARHQKERHRSRLHSPRGWMLALDVPDG